MINKSNITIVLYIVASMLRKGSVCMWSASIEILNPYQATLQSNTKGQDKEEVVTAKIDEHQTA